MSREGYARLLKRVAGRGKASARVSFYGLAPLREEDVAFFRMIPAGEHGACWRYEFERQVAARFVSGKFAGCGEGDARRAILPAREAVKRAWQRDYLKPWPCLTEAQRRERVKAFEAPFQSGKWEMAAYFARNYEERELALRDKRRVESFRANENRALPWNFPGVMADPDPALVGDAVVFKIDWSLSKTELVNQFARALDRLGEFRARMPGWPEYLRAIAAQRLIDNCPPGMKPWEFAEGFADRDLSTELGLIKAARRYRALEEARCIDLVPSESGASAESDCEGVCLLPQIVLHVGR